MWYCLGIKEDTRRKRSSLDELVVIYCFGDGVKFHMIHVVLSGNNRRHTLMELNVYVER